MLDTEKLIVAMGIVVLAGRLIAQTLNFLRELLEGEPPILCVLAWICTIVFHASAVFVICSPVWLLHGWL